MLENKKKIYLVIAVSVISFVVLGFFVINPLFEQIKKASLDITLERITFMALEKQIMAFDDFKQSFKNYEQDFQKIKASFVNKAVPLPFINFLENQAKIHNIELSISIVPFAQAEEGLWQKTLFQLSLQGGFNGCLRFLEQLENSPWFLDITSLNVSKAGFNPKSEQSNVELSLEISVFSNEQYTENNI